MSGTVHDLVTTGIQTAQVLIFLKVFFFFEDTTECLKQQSTKHNASH